MDKKITNKRVDLSDIVRIAEMVERHCKYYKDMELAEQKKKDEAKARDEYYSMKFFSGSVKYSIEFNNNETITKEDELGWFVETLMHNAKTISSVSIAFYATEEEKRESLHVYFTHNRIDYDTSTTNMNDNPLSNMVESYIQKLPERYDELVVKDSRRKMIPALTISAPLGMIISFVLLILAKMDVITGGIAKFLTNGVVLTLIFVIVAFFGVLLIPTKNTDLYRNIKFETYYAGYDSKNYRSIHKDDYEEYKSRCEVAIGENANMPAVRQNIELNYNKAKKVLKIESIISVVSIALFFIL